MCSSDLCTMNNLDGLCRVPGTGVGQSQVKPFFSNELSGRSHGREHSPPVNEVLQHERRMRLFCRKGSDSFKADSRVPTFQALNESRGIVGDLLPDVCKPGLQSALFFGGEVHAKSDDVGILACEFDAKGQPQTELCCVCIQCFIRESEIGRASCRERV